MARNWKPFPLLGYIRKGTFFYGQSLSIISLPSGFPGLISLRYDSQSRTLTCTSTGGPATTVTWRRDWVVITLNATYQQTKRVVNTTAGTYQTVLTIDSSVVIVGAYNCTVENARGSDSTTLVLAGNGELIPYMHCFYIDSLVWR